MNSPLKYFFNSLLIITIPFNLYGQGSALLVGGGSEDYHDWSDEPYGWFVQQSDSGKIINIDVDETSDWYPEYFKWLGASSDSKALRITSQETANDSTIYRELISAAGIFIEGGDQWDYISTWKGTLVEEAIHHVFMNGGAIGGTSAGLAVLGEVVFDAKNGSAYPEETAYDPYHSRISLTDDFLEILPNIITDSHFHTRGRIGRLIPMLARRIQDNGQNDLIAIGIAERTAFCINREFTGSVYGRATVTLLYKDQNSKIVCQPQRPLTFTNIHFDQLIHGAVYDLQTHTLIDGSPYLHPVNKQPQILDFSAVALTGSDENTAQLGEIVVTNLTSDNLNAWYGRLGMTAGDSLIPKSVIIPKLWNEYQYFENRLIGGMYSVASYPSYTTIYLDNNSNPFVTSDGILVSDNLVYVLDTSAMTYAGFNQSAVSNYPGIVGAKIHFLTTGDSYDLQSNMPVTGLINEDSPLPEEFSVFTNYPNPFNAETTIEYYLPRSTNVNLVIFNMRGQEIKVLVDEFQNTGVHRIFWDASDVSSGIYFYKISTDNVSETRKSLLIK